MKMTDMQQLPLTLFPVLCEMLKEELPTSIKILSILSRSHTTSESKVYTKLIDGKPDPSVVVVKNCDERFKKFGIEQDVFIYVHTQDQLNKVFENKNIVDVSKVMLIRGIREECMNWYQAASKRQEGKLKNVHEYVLYRLDDEKKLVTDVPPECSVGPVTELEHIHRMKVSWLYRELVSNDEFKRMMLSDLSMGLYLNMLRSNTTHHFLDSRHLVSWAVCNLEGSISLVTTVSEHQNKGYGKIVISELCQLLKAAGRIPVCDIDERNTALCQLFESLGFTKVFQHSWAFHVPEHPAEVEKFSKVINEIRVIDNRVFKPVVSNEAAAANTSSANGDPKLAPVNVTYAI